VQPHQQCDEPDGDQGRRIARRAGLTRLCLGEGKNGIVRYIREEVAAYEASRRITMNA
jgi:hypothetical protein